MYLLSDINQIKSSRFPFRSQTYSSSNRTEKPIYGSRSSLRCEKQLPNGKQVQASQLPNQRIASHSNILSKMPNQGQENKKTSYNCRVERVSTLRVSRQTKSSNRLEKKSLKISENCDRKTEESGRTHPPLELKLKSDHSAINPSSLISSSNTYTHPFSLISNPSTVPNESRRPNGCRMDRHFSKISALNAPSISNISKISIDPTNRNRQIRIDVKEDNQSKLLIMKPIKSILSNIFGYEEFGCECHDENIHTKQGYRGCEWARWAEKWSQAERPFEYNQIQAEKCDPTVEQQIEKDVNRTQPNLKAFQGQYFRGMLKKVLKKYSVYDPATAYIQGMNLVVSCILFHIKNEENTFWIFEKLMSGFGLRRVYEGDSFKGYETHISKIQKMVEIHLNRINTHLQNNGVSLRQVCFPWILSLMAVLVPPYAWAEMFRHFSLQGWHLIYKVCVFYLASIRRELLKCRDSADLLLALSVSESRERDSDEQEWSKIIQLASLSNI